MTSPPLDLATADELVAAHLPALLDALERITLTLRRRHAEDAITVRLLDAEELVTHGRAESPALLLGFVTVDDRDRGKLFRSVRLHLTRATGELVTVDDSGLLASV